MQGSLLRVFLCQDNVFVVCLNNGLFKYLCRTADDNIVEGLKGTQGNIEGKLTNLLFLIRMRPKGRISEATE